jgi:hypothetical protein
MKRRGVQAADEKQRKYDQQQHYVWRTTSDGVFMLTPQATVFALAVFTRRSSQESTSRIFLPPPHHERAGTSSPSHVQQPLMTLEHLGGRQSGRVHGRGPSASASGLTAARHGRDERSPAATHSKSERRQRDSARRQRAATMFVDNLRNGR